MPTQVATSIRNHPADYRGVVVGSDAFPDIVGGQGNVHPDTHAEDGAQAHEDWTPGHSYAYEWLALVYRAGWNAYDKCGGCTAGQRDLAFTYGYLTHAGEDMWGHTFVNGFAEGVFPAVSAIDDTHERNIAIRHVVTGGYVGLHTPATTTTIDAPTDFVYDTFIANPTAAVLGGGSVIDHSRELRAALVAEVADRTDYIDHGTLTGCGWPVNWKAGAEREYLEAWIEDIDTGLRAYPELSLKIARDLFDGRKADTAKLRADIADYVNAHLISMVGYPDFLGRLATWGTSISRWAADVLDPILEPLDRLLHDFANTIVEDATGFALDEWVGYFENPGTHINNASLGFAPDTSRQLDRLMDLNSAGTFNPDRFAAMKDTINMAKLILLNGAGLTKLLESQHAAAYELPDVAGYPQNIMVQVTGTTPQSDKMIGWIKSLDGDHQWLAKSPRDGQSYGTGGMYLWKSCNARPVFRALFTGWEHPTNFPDSEDPSPCTPHAVTRPFNLIKPAIAPLGAPQLCHLGVCGPAALFLSPGTWRDGETLWYSYTWTRLGFGCTGGILKMRCDVPMSSVVSSTPEYTLTRADAGVNLIGTVTATNEYGKTATATVAYKVRGLDLTAPVVSISRVDLPTPAVQLHVSKAAELTVTLSKLTGHVSCQTLGREGQDDCEDWTSLEGSPALPGGALLVSAEAGDNIVSLAPFGELEPGMYEVAVRPKDLVGNVGDYDSTTFAVAAPQQP